ncbi:MAG: patatin-like phospholipase family protein [Rhodospirillales bacterium]|nr:patatin-like phospholipase family protein [Rhodospirillales bacterium]MCW9040738.1 patatin-like phospholipase family protein [Rhodospirillales bacterium]
MIDDDPPFPHRSRPVIGLALGSGMARGFAHIGALKALDEAGIIPDVVVGTSMGAVVGGAYLAGKLHAVEEWATSLTSRSLWRQLDFSFTSGLVDGARLTRMLHEGVGGIRFSELDKPFICVAADLINGREVWLREGRVSRAIRASFSLPGAFKPVKIGGRWLVDGAMVNPVPVSVCHALGADVVIAVNVNGDLLGKKRYNHESETDPGSLSFALEQADDAGAGERLLGMAKRVVGASTEAPVMFRVMAASLNILLDRIARSRLAGDPADVNVIPRLGHIGLMEFHRAKEIIEEGYKAAQRSAERIKDSIEGFQTAFQEEH